MSVVRRFVYVYNGNERMQETEEDPTGVREIPAVGSTIIRVGREWCVISIYAPISVQGTTPLVRVYLRDKGLRGFIGRFKEHEPSGA